MKYLVDKKTRKVIASGTLAEPDDNHFVVDIHKEVDIRRSWSLDKSNNLTQKKIEKEVKKKKSFWKRIFRRR